MCCISKPSFGTLWRNEDVNEFILSKYFCSPCDLNLHFFQILYMEEEGLQEALHAR